MCFAFASVLALPVWIVEAGGGVFSSMALAEQWISRWALSGLLTKYPLDTGAYDWAIAHQQFLPKKPEHTSGKFVGSFVGAWMEHPHYENGCRLA